MKLQIKNKFNFSEWSGAFGDLGTLLPLAFALIVFNGFSPVRLFFLWGLVYIVTGFYFKVPISVQPLKAMSVIAIASGISPNQLSSAAFFFGIIIVLFTSFGVIKKLQKVFSEPIIRGIQIGVGMILAKKAIQLILNNGFLLHIDNGNVVLLFSATILIIFLIYIFQIKLKVPFGLIVVLSSVLFVYFTFGVKSVENTSTQLVNFSLPNFSFFLNALVLLIIPQIPLTIGNAIYAAKDTAHELWKEKAVKVNENKLGYSIGVSDILIGIFGGFPICHGSGGIAAHGQFGAKTGGSTIILGSILVISAIFPTLSNFLFLIPVPVLAALLIFDSFRMSLFVLKLENYSEISVASTVGIISFLTKNLTYGLIAGFVLEFVIKHITQLNLKETMDGGSK